MKNNAVIKKDKSNKTFFVEIKLERKTVIVEAKSVNNVSDAVKEPIKDKR